MRITDQQKEIIKKVVATEVVNGDAQVTLFGSRTDDTKKGGDIDLLITLSEPVVHPAELSATISAKLIRQFQGRKVDVLLSAPNLKHLPIHSVAQQTGIRL